MKQNKNAKSEQERETERLLARVERESGGVLDSLARKAGGKAARDGVDPDDDENTWPVVWGKRLGRILAVVLLVYLLFSLGLRAGLFE